MMKIIQKRHSPLNTPPHVYNTPGVKWTFWVRSFYFVIQDMFTDLFLIYFFCDICPFLIAFRFLFSISTWLFPTTSSVFFTVKVRTIKKIEVQFLWNGERLSFCLHHCKMKQYLQPDIGNFWEEWFCSVFEISKCVPGVV